MFSKLIFVLVTLCVVNASVISNNVFDDDPETEVASNPKGCNYRECDQRCRRLKFPGGACVNGRCKCDNFLNTDDEISDNTLSDLEDLVSLKEEDPDTEVASNPKGCNYQECDQRCRRLKFPGGSCVNGRCKCDLFLNTEDAVSESNVADSVPSRACNNNRCNQVCRKKKFRGGACVGANCYCHKFLSLLEDTMTDPAESLPLSSCNSIACNDQCQRTGWHSGVCINGQCKCDYFLNTEVSENALSNLEDSVSSRKCNHQECNAQCRRLLFREGVCIAGRCSCNNYIPIPEDTVNNLEESISLDDNFLITEDDVSDESLLASELSEDQTERGCNMQACDQLCRRLKFSGGACVNGRCKCDNFFGTEVDAVDEYSELATRRVCDLRKCNRTCTRRGYEVARCVNGRCKCYNKTQAEDVISETQDVFPLPISELSEDQTERGCNMQACDQLCRRLKYPGGACVNGRCKCDNFFGTEVDAVDEYSELATRRVCDLWKCNRTCTRRGYEVARCVNGRCKCYDKIQRQDASALNDVTSDENEGSNIISRTDEDAVDEYSEFAPRRVCRLTKCSRKCTRRGFEGGSCVDGGCKCFNNLQEQEELIVPSPRACNTVNCNQMCHRLNYAGGWCRFGQCRCY